LHTLLSSRGQTSMQATFIMPSARWSFLRANAFAEVSVVEDFARTFAERTLD
jgi:hypothetical protein